MNKVLKELSDMNGSEKHFDARFTELMDQIDKHGEMEEEEMFDEARSRSLCSCRAKAQQKTHQSEAFAGSS